MNIKIKYNIEQELVFLLDCDIKVDQENFELLKINNIYNKYKILNIPYELVKFSGIINTNILKKEYLNLIKDTNNYNISNNFYDFLLYKDVPLELSIKANLFLTNTIKNYLIYIDNNQIISNFNSIEDLKNRLINFELKNLKDNQIYLNNLKNNLYEKLKISTYNFYI